MSIDIAKLRMLQRQAGRAVADAGTPSDKASLPQPLFFKEGSQPLSREESATIARATSIAGLARDDDDVRSVLPANVPTRASKAPEVIPSPRTDATAPLFEKEGLGEICSSLPDARTPLFGKDGLPEIRSARPDLDGLRRLIAQRERKPGTSPLPQPTAFAARPTQAPGPIDRSVPGQEIAPGLYFSEVHLSLPAPQVSLSLAFAKRPDDALDPRRLMFFDTETTGLAGGTGTRAFMIGAADWHRDAVHGDGLRIRQLTIATLAAEPAMLRAFAQWLTPDTVLSSYNGRCYDAPLLNTRYRLARIANPLAGLDHVDLLFPTRRLYRGVWENCKLATIERELLRIVREDDLPGSQAPAAWLHYLRGGSSALLRRVAAHNHQDVVTLAQLMLKLVEAQAALPV
ncbi:ribonuclease H-like domain-containing protein [Lysobacter antibioticus]|uniref:ribonuclease H-like domain-containing protein n=1 Tax=Lysobacter TaxID=68 RepID=UPI001F1727FC|nr:ribonuclease H-like domain-containing protein [Lysobacter antibioticus]